MKFLPGSQRAWDAFPAHSSSGGPADTRRCCPDAVVRTENRHRAAQCSQDGSPQLTPPIPGAVSPALPISGAGSEAPRAIGASVDANAHQSPIETRTAVGTRTACGADPGPVQPPPGDVGDPPSCSPTPGRCPLPPNGAGNAWLGGGVRSAGGSAVTQRTSGSCSWMGPGHS